MINCPESRPIVTENETQDERDRGGLVFTRPAQWISPLSLTAPRIA